MIVSGTILKTALERYKNTRPTKEGFSAGESAQSGAAAAFASFGVAVGVIFFILELVMLFYAINMALVCSEGGPERIVNVVLAVTFTIPYVLLNILFNKCAKSTLKGSGWLPSGLPKK